MKNIVQTSAVLLFLIAVRISPVAASERVSSAPLEEKIESSQFAGVWKVRWAAIRESGGKIYEIESGRERLRVCTDLELYPSQTVVLLLRSSAVRGSCGGDSINLTSENSLIYQVHRDFISDEIWLKVRAGFSERTNCNAVRKIAVNYVTDPKANINGLPGEGVYFNINDLNKCLIDGGSNKRLILR